MPKHPRPYQVTAIERGADQNLLIADAPGLGKTLQAIEIAKVQQARHSAPVLIICPKVLRQQWQDQIAEQVPGARIVILQTEMQPRGPVKSDAIAWVITHYEAAVKHIKKLSATLWATVVIDEAHKIRNRDAQRTKAIKKLQAHRKILATATPFDRNPADVWSLLHFLDPAQYNRRGTTYWDFFNRHTAYEERQASASGRTVTYKVIKGTIDPLALAQEIKPYVITRSKQDVATQLPPKLIQTIPLALTDAQREAYEQIEDADDILVDIGGIEGEILVKNVLSRILHLQKIVSDPLLVGLDIPSAKFDWLEERLEAMPEDDTILILTRFRDTALRLARRFDLPCVVGGTRLDFDPKTQRRIVGTIAAMGEGLDLGQIWTTVFWDREWSSILMYQALDRTERDLTATQPREIIYLHVPGTVDDLIRDVNEAKLSTVELVRRYVAGKVKDVL